MFLLDHLSYFSLIVVIAGIPGSNWHAKTLALSIFVLKSKFNKKSVSMSIIILYKFHIKDARLLVY